MRLINGTGFRSRLNVAVDQDSPTPEELAEALARLATLDPAEAAEPAEELAAKLARLLDETEAD